MAARARSGENGRMGYVLAVTWVARPGEEEAVADVLRKMVPATQAEPGCIHYYAHPARAREGVPAPPARPRRPPLLRPPRPRRPPPLLPVRGVRRRGRAAGPHGQRPLPAARHRRGRAATRAPAAAAAPS